jgi:hypothetical protein
MSAIEYRRRASLSHEGEALWRAHCDKLEYFGPSGVLISTLRYRNVRRIHLNFSPARAQDTRFIMEVTGLRSRRMISNTHLAESGQLEDRSGAFFPFVRQVASGVWKANPDAEFVAGEPPAVYWLLLGVNAAVLLALMALVLSLPVLPRNEALAALLKAGLMVFSLGLMLSWAIHARPRRLRSRRDLEHVLAARSD